MASLLELGINTGRWDAGLRKAQNSMNSFIQSQGGLQKALDKENGKMSQFVRMMGQMGSTAKTTRGQMNDYKNTIEQLTAQYNRMTAAQKRTIGKDYLNTIEQLKQKYRDAKNESDALNRSLEGNSKSSMSLKGVATELGNRFAVNADLMGMITTGTVAYTAAIGAAVVAVGAAAKAWAEYNSELAKQDQITTVTTGLSGSAGAHMTDALRALSKTYNVDFREAVNAANTLMTQFGVTGDKAIQLLQDGMQGMIMGDGPKLLQMIQQYAPAFRDAGISASQLVAIIHNSEGGIFTDQNMNAIVMGIKNIRLMTKSTSDALAKMGIDGAKMTQELNNGTKTIFEAMSEVAGRIDEVGSSSQAAGEVMQQVFGRQGVTAGTNIGKAIETLNLNLEETKKQTGEVGKSLAVLNQATEQLETSMREAVGVSGWQELTNVIETGLVVALNDVVKGLTVVKDTLGSIPTYIYDLLISPAYALVDAFTDVQVAGTSALANIGRFAVAAASPLTTVVELLRLTGLTKGGGGTKMGDMLSSALSNLNLPTNTPKATFTAPTLTGGKGGGRSGGGHSSHGTTTTTKEETEFQKNKKRIEELKQEYVTATNERRAAIETEIQTLQKRNEEIQRYYDMALGKTPKAQSVDLPSGQANFSGSVIPSLKDMVLRKGNETPKPAETDSFKKFTNNMSDVTGNVGSILSGLEQLGIEVPQELQNIVGGIQVVTGILTAISALVTIISASQQTQAVTSIISAIKPFARGGVVHAAGGYTVPGRHFSGDQVPALLNSGEVVLNRAQQGNLASQLSTPGYGGHLEAVVSGEQLRFVLNGNGRRTGRGELLTTNFR